MVSSKNEVDNNKGSLMAVEFGLFSLHCLLKY